MLGARPIAQLKTWPRTPLSRAGLDRWLRDSGTIRPWSRLLRQACDAPAHYPTSKVPGKQHRKRYIEFC